MLAKAGDTTGAKQAYRQAIGLDPDFTEMADTLRAQLAKHGKPVHLEVIDVRSRPPDPEITAIAALHLGDLLSAETGTDAAEQAQQAYQRAARTGSPPVAARALLSLGYLLAKHGDPDGARDAFDRAIGTADSDVAPKAAVNLGLILTQQRNIGTAREAFQLAIDSGHPEASPVAGLFLGKVLAAAGETNGARNAYKIACASGTAEIAEVASHSMRELPRQAHQQPG